VLVREAVRAGWPVDDVFVGEGFDLDLDGVRTTTVTAGVLERVATTVTARPVVAIGHQRAAALDELREASFVLVLADVSDPGNLGTMLRTAEAAGADGVVVCGGVDVFNPKCVRASAGSIFFVPIVPAEHARSALEALGPWGLLRLGTSANATETYDDVDLRARVAIVLGSEAHGLPAEVVQSVDHMVSIPIVGRGESLNVAAAAAVLCFEVARQRRSS
jgi:RNA methyltransferase, TrmH family